MVNAEYKHPHYPSVKAEKKVVLDTPSHKIVRMEYPDGVVVIFDMNGDEIKIQSNHDFILDTANVISPKLDSPNKKFKDII